MIITIDAVKAFDKIQHHFVIATLKKLRLEENLLKIIKVLYEKATANIILNGERLKVVPLRSGIKQGCLLSPRVFNLKVEYSTWKFF